MFQIALPKIECVECGENYGKFIAEPVEKGFGVILGNSLRRVLLSSLQGAAVTSVLIDGVTQEFTSIPYMKEDVTNFLLNIRDIRIRMLTKSATAGKMLLGVEGKKKVYAADITVADQADFEIANPDLYLATLDSSEAKLNAEFMISAGKGYQPAGSEDDNKGFIVTGGGTSKEISIDAIFSPVTRVNYVIESSGPGHGAGKERLVLEIWTDGTIEPAEAVRESASILVEQFDIFKSLAGTSVAEDETGSIQKLIPVEIYNMPLDKLSLSTHTYNSLRRGGITSVGQLLEKGIDGLMLLGGFGAKSREEVEAALKQLNVDLPNIQAAGEKKKKSKVKASAPEGEEK